MENQSNIRNLIIISHIDHGKSTLADRFLELTKTIPKEKMRPQYLDMMDLEREKGITIKMQPVRMNYPLQTTHYALNLIDTPGHVDFSYEVSRSLAAVEGGILLVEAIKGIQAQTISNLDLAKEQNLIIIPAVNKIDLPQAKIEETRKELANLLGVQEKEVFLISAKFGTNVEKLLKAVIKKIPPPRGNPEKPLRALIFDSKYDLYKGVIAYVRIIDGKVSKGENIYFLQAGIEGTVKEVGYFRPELSPHSSLSAGEIGYIATGVKEPGKIRVGDTITSLKFKIQGLKLPEALSGYKKPKPMVFASIYPENPNDYELLREALTKLKLNDPSFILEFETKAALGRGFCCGFLGSFHAEIVSERLFREFGLNLVITTPSVIFKITKKDGKEISIYSPQDWPAPGEIKEIKESWITLKVLTPTNYLGQVLEILEDLNGSYIERKYISSEDKRISEKIILVYEVPLREIIVGFYSKLKGITQGFASMNYKFLGYRPADLVKLEVLIAGAKEEAFSKIVLKDRSFEEGKKMIKKLKEVLPPQLFSVALQATIGSKIIARETIRAKRKDVTSSLYGGDYTRKKKLLQKQKKGKKKLKARGKIKIPPKVFLEIFKSK